MTPFELKTTEGKPVADLQELTDIFRAASETPKTPGNPGRDFLAILYENMVFEGLVNETSGMIVESPPISDDERAQVELSIEVLMATADRRLELMMIQIVKLNEIMAWIKEKISRGSREAIAHNLDVFSSCTTDKPLPRLPRESSGLFAYIFKGVSEFKRHANYEDKNGDYAANTYLHEKINGSYNAPLGQYIVCAKLMDALEEKGWVKAGGFIRDFTLTKEEAETLCTEFNVAQTQPSPTMKNIMAILQKYLGARMH